MCQKIVIQETNKSESKLRVPSQYLVEERLENWNGVLKQEPVKGLH